MTRSRILAGSIVTCAMLMAGLFIGSTRSAQTQLIREKLALSAASARQPFAESLGASAEAGQWASNPQAGTPLTVPSGRTMVLDYVSAYVNIAPGQQPIMLLRIGQKGVRPNTGSSWVLYLNGREVPIPNATQHMVVASQPLGLHLQAGDTIRAELMRPQTETAGRLYASMTVSGYLE